MARGLGLISNVTPSQLGQDQLRSCLPYSMSLGNKLTDAISYP
jgi:hypothetical protein